MSGHDALDALATELFRTFSRVEYALKASGYNTGDGDATANWTMFAKEPAVEALVAAPQDPAMQAAIAFIFGAPPKKQVVENGLLAWKVVEPATNSQADRLLIYVRRVRNNLFHGGKFNGHWFEPERSRPLLEHSLVVLQAVVAAVPAVFEAYKG